MVLAYSCSICTPSFLGLTLSAYGYLCFSFLSPQFLCLLQHLHIPQDFNSALCYISFLYYAPTCRTKMAQSISKSAVGYRNYFFFCFTFCQQHNRASCLFSIVINSQCLSFQGGQNCGHGNIQVAINSFARTSHQTYVHRLYLWLQVSSEVDRDKIIVSLDPYREHLPSDCVVHQKKYNRNYASWNDTENFNSDKEAYKLENKYFSHLFIKKNLASLIQKVM